MNENQGMSIGRQLWRVVYPLLIYYLISSFMLYITMLSIVTFDYMKDIASYSSEYLMEHMQEIVDSYTSTEALNGYYQVFLAYYPSAVMLTNLVSIPLSTLFFWLDRRKDSKDWHTGRWMVPWGIVAGIAGVFCCLFANLIASAFISISASAGIGEMGSATAVTPDTWLFHFQESLAGRILYTGFIGAIAEEILFRGLLYRRLRQYRGVGMAIMWAACLYSAFYGTLATAIYGIIVAICACLIYERFRSLLAPILFHICMNILSVVLSGEVLERVNELLASDFRGLIFGAFCFAGLAVCYILITYYMNPKETNDNETADNNGSFL